MTQSTTPLADQLQAAAEAHQAAAGMPCADGLGAVLLAIIAPEPPTHLSARDAILARRLHAGTEAALPGVKLPDAMGARLLLMVQPYLEPAPKGQMVEQYNPPAAHAEVIAKVAAGLRPDVRVHAPSGVGSNKTN